jgi:hypothetical protein
MISASWGALGARQTKKAPTAKHRSAVSWKTSSHPVRIVALNTAEGWSRDVTVDIGDELRRRFPEYDEVPRSVQDFLETAVRH